MRWFFKQTRFQNGIYEYAYSHETKDYDGLIRYDSATKKLEVAKPCLDDFKSNFAQEWSLMHFHKVINKGFPETLSVITG